MNKVKLVFDDLIIGLAGDGYGREVYKQQVNGKIDLSKPFTLEFPERITIISTHFVSGMISEMLEKSFVDIDTIRRNITIEGNKNFVEKFYLTIDKEGTRK